MAQKIMTAGSMVGVEDDPDISRMLGAGVGLDDDGEFDPTNLLSQPINFDEDIDDLGINMDDEDAGDATYLGVTNEGDSAIQRQEVEQNNSRTSFDREKPRNEVEDPNEKYFRTPSPTYHRQPRSRHYGHGRNEDTHRRSTREHSPPPRHSSRRHSPHRHSPGRHTPRRHSPHPPHGHSPRRHSPHRQSYPPPDPHHRDRSPKNERIAEVQQRIRQVQQQIHKNIDDDRSSEIERMPHSYRRGPPPPGPPGPPGYSPHSYRRGPPPPGYSPNESYRNGDPRDRYLTPPRDSPHHARHRSYNGMPSNMRNGGEMYGGEVPESYRRRSHQQPLQQPHRGGPPMISPPPDGMHPQESDNGYGPQDQRHPMPPTQRGNMPVHNSNSHTGPGAFRNGPGNMPPQQHVLGGMAQSLNGMGRQGNGNNNSPMMQEQQQQQQQHGPPQHMRPVSQSFNGDMPNMNTSNNRNMPRKGIQSMSDSLNGVNNQPRMSPTNNGMDRSANGMNRSQNGMDGSSNRGIQSMSASLNGMQNMNSSSNNNPNAMAPQLEKQRGIQSMSASLNGMQQMNAGQNMSRSMNGSMNGMQGGYGDPRGPRSSPTGGLESMGMPMNRSMNGMAGGNFPHRGMNGMSRSQNGMPNMSSSQNGGFPRQSPVGGGHPLQGMSQSLNGAPSAPYGHMSMPNRMGNMSGDPRMQMSNNSNMSMMNRSNAMGRSMNGSMGGPMNVSNNGRMLNNSNVPSAPLLNQVSNLANLPNRSGGPNNPDMMQRMPGQNYETTKLSRKLMEAMKRTASSRKLIRDLNIGAMLRGDLKSFAPTSPNKNKGVIKAKRKASRQSYTKSQKEAATSREFEKAQKKEQQQQTVVAS